MSPVEVTAPRSDVGRRIAERRRSLGLSVEDLAGRAGMDPRYVRGVESRRAPDVSSAAMQRFARALETTVDALSGAPLDLPPHESAVSLEEISERECWRLVSGAGVGRVVVDVARGPIALPVNFAVAGKRILFRTKAEGEIARGVRSGRVSFEVDRVDDAEAEGWSVLVTGDATLRRGPCEDVLPGGPEVGPWAAGHGEACVELRADVVTGRRIRRPPRTT